MKLSAKEAGAYYTPEGVVSSLLRWTLRSDGDRLLDPSCGDGRFIAAHRNSFGIEQDPDAAASAMLRAPWALIHEGDFFNWAAHTAERFDCAVGNPPFIRYQSFKGEARERALRLCARLGASFSGLTSSWAPFLVAAASLLKPGGRMAFVVPAEIGHAPYAAPLLDYVLGHFELVQVIAIREKLFEDLSEDCWLLYAEGYGGTTDELCFTALDRFEASDELPRPEQRIPIREWRDDWRRRLRPYLLPESIRALYRDVAGHTGSRRLGDVAAISIGYVSGANDFFHLRPSEAEYWEIPAACLHPTVRNGRALSARSLTRTAVEQWQRSDQPIMLLKLPKAAELPAGVRKYIDSESGQQARQAYKCRVRDPWYSVPDVQVPDFFLTYMSGLTPNLVQNAAGATCTNSVHRVRVRDFDGIGRALKNWDNPFIRLSCELEGHPLGGGMLKLEPREATQILLPASALLPELGKIDIADAVSVLQAWRHHVTPS